MSRIIDAVRSGPGELAPDVRQAIMDGVALPEPLASYVTKVSAHPRQVADEDVQTLLRAGYSEDQIFEATVSSALTAGLKRLEAGLAALTETGP